MRRWHRSGPLHFDLRSDFVDVPAVLDGLRVAGSGNSRRDFEPNWRYSHFEPHGMTRFDGAGVHHRALNARVIPTVLFAQASLAGATG